MWEHTIKVRSRHNVSSDITSDKEKMSALELLDKIKSEIVSKLGYRCETAVALEGKNSNGMEIFTLKFNLGAYNI